MPAQASQEGNQGLWGHHIQGQTQGHHELDRHKAWSTMAKPTSSSSSNLAYSWSHIATTKRPRIGPPGLSPCNYPRGADLSRYPKNGSCPRKGVPTSFLPNITTSPDLGGFSDSPWPSSQCSAHHSVLPALLLVVLSTPTPAPSLPPLLCPKQQAYASEGPHIPPTSAQNLPSQLGLT